MAGAEQSMRLEYATEFAVDLYAGGYKLLTLGDGSRFLVVPEGASLPKGIARILSRCISR